MIDYLKTIKPALHKNLWSYYGFLFWDKNRDKSKTEKLIDIILRNLTLNSSSNSVLDAGCGTGYIAKELTKHGFQVTGIDYAPGMIKIAERDNSNQYTSYMIADLSKQLPFTDNNFNYVINISSLQLVPNPLFTLKELKRVVKKNGKIVLVHFGKPIKKRKVVQVKGYDLNKIPSISKSILNIKSTIECLGFSKFWNFTQLESLCINADFVIEKKINISNVMVFILVKK